MHRVLQEYNRILGVKEIHNRDQLKRAYRRQAKSLHPDSRNGSSSHEDFLMLQQAYEFYLKAFDGSLQLEIRQAIHDKKYTRQDTANPVQEELRKEARKKAAEKAQRKQEIFESKGYFKILDNMFFIITILRVIQASLLLIGLPVFLFYVDGIRGLICVLIVQGFTYPLWSPYIRVLYKRRRNKQQYRYF